MNNKELIKNHLIFHAYFCHLIEQDQLNDSEDLCRISLELSEEIVARKIDENQITKHLNSENFSPSEKLLVIKYLYPELKNWC